MNCTLQKYVKPVMYSLCGASLFLIHFLGISFLCALSADLHKVNSLQWLCPAFFCSLNYYLKQDNIRIWIIENLLQLIQFWFPTINFPMGLKTLPKFLSEFCWSCLLACRAATGGFTAAASLSSPGSGSSFCCQAERYLSYTDKKMGGNLVS